MQWFRWQQLISDWYHLVFYKVRPPGGFELCRARAFWDFPVSSLKNFRASSSFLTENHCCSRRGVRSDWSSSGGLILGGGWRQRMTSCNFLMHKFMQKRQKSCNLSNNSDCEKLEKARRAFVSSFGELELNGFSESSNSSELELFALFTASRAFSSSSLARIHH